MNYIKNDLKKHLNTLYLNIYNAQELFAVDCIMQTYGNIPLKTFPLPSVEYYIKIFLRFYLIFKICNCSYIQKRLDELKLRHIKVI